jgi:hypothetical protein
LTFPGANGGLKVENVIPDHVIDAYFKAERLYPFFNGRSKILMI